MAHARHAQLSAHSFAFVGEPGAAGSAHPLPAESDTAPAMSRLGFSDLDRVKREIPLDVKAHCVLSNVTDSIVACAGMLRMTLVNASRLRNSVVVLRCAGPVFLHELRNVVVVASCHQLRVHNSQDITVFVEEIGGNRLVIEKCGGVRVRCGGGRPRPQVDDFDWPTQEHANPHVRVEEACDDDYGWIDAIGEGALLASDLERLWAEVGSELKV